jgi:hypothetical protein
MRLYSPGIDSLRKNNKDGDPDSTEYKLMSPLFLSPDAPPKANLDVFRIWAGDSLIPFMEGARDKVPTNVIPKLEPVGYQTTKCARNLHGQILSQSNEFAPGMHLLGALGNTRYSLIEPN